MKINSEFEVGVNMKDTDKAWIAGIIDGEGSIFVMKQKRKDRDRDTNFILRVSVQSADPFMTTELNKWYPGAEFVVRKDKRESCSDTMKWQLNGKRAIAFLKDILPYMKVKNKQAELAISFQETTKKHWKHMTDIDYTQQQYFYQELKNAKAALKLGKNYLYGTPGA